MWAHSQVSKHSGPEQNFPSYLQHELEDAHFRLYSSGMKGRKRLMNKKQRQTLPMFFAMKMEYPKHWHIDHMLRCAFINKKRTIAYFSDKSYKQKAPALNVSQSFFARYLSQHAALQMKCSYIPSSL